MKHALKLRGKFTLEQSRGGIIIARREMWNGITDVGKDELLKVAFSGETAAMTWYLGLINGTTLADADTMASHAGWSEITDVDEATREAWLSSDLVSSQSLTGDPAAEYNIDNVAGATIHGLFVTSDNTLGGSTGILWSTGLFGSVINANDNDLVKLTYTLSVD